MLRRARTYFIAGLAVLFPLLATAYIVVFVFNFLDGFLAGVIAAFAGRRIPGAGAVAAVVLVFAVGVLATNFLGRRLIALGEAILVRLPIVKGIYGTMKQIVDAFAGPGQSSFKRVSLVEYPRRGLWAVGFVTGESRGEIQEKTEDVVVNVFLPTSPNPTSGFLILVPRDEVIPLEMSVEDGLKLVISGGVITPPDRAESAPSPDAAGGGGIPGARGAG